MVELVIGVFCNREVAIVLLVSFLFIWFSSIFLYFFSSQNLVVFLFFENILRFVFHIYLVPVTHD